VIARSPAGLVNYFLNDRRDVGRIKLSSLCQTPDDIIPSYLGDCLFGIISATDSYSSSGLIISQIAKSSGIRFFVANDRGLASGPRFGIFCRKNEIGFCYRGTLGDINISESHAAAPFLGATIKVTRRGIVIGLVPSPI